MAEVTKYHVLVYGGPEGYQTNRSQIALYGTAGNTIAYVRFNDPDMGLEKAVYNNEVITMHRPGTMFQSVLDILRNEKPIQIYFAQGRGFFGTGTTEPVGENE